VLEAYDRILCKTGGELGLIDSSNLTDILETVQDIGEHLPKEEAVRRKVEYLLYNMVNIHQFLNGNMRTAFKVTKNLLRLNSWLFEPKE